MGEIMIRTFSRLAAPVLVMPRSVKRVIVLALDGALCILSVWLAFYLRKGTYTPLSGPAILPAVVSVALALPVFITSGLYRAIFLHSGLPAMVAVGPAMLLYGLAFAVIFTLWGVEGVPRTVGLIQPILFLLLVGASRAAARVWLGGLYNQQLRKASLPQALIYGAGNAVRQLASAMANSHDVNFPKLKTI
jgi:FlaA1/EpsC-like NDP-sugar epimerase